MKKCIPLLAGSLFSLSSFQASAETIYATTVFQRLVSFDSATPGTFITDVPISGLTDAFESIAGIDFRPANGQLFALGNAPGSIYRLYTLNLATGAATRVGTTNLTLAGTFWGFDFNPVVDRIRVVNDSNLNFRMNPNDGTQVTPVDTSLNPAGSVVAAAYDRNDNNGATPTTLFGIDSASDMLVRIGGVDGAPSPNGGVVTNIGALGVDTVGNTSFDISFTGVAFASLSTVGGGIPSSLYTVNLTSGAATLVGQIGDGSDGVTGLSAVVPEPATAALLGFAGLLLGLRRQRR